MKRPQPIAVRAAAGMPRPAASAAIVIAASVALVVLSTAIAAHPMTGSNARFVQGVGGPAIVPFAYLGAKHMITGYDHVLFLAGVIFFLYRLKDVVLYVSLFTLGHSLTLLGGVLSGVAANTYLIDAIIGLSVVYKAFENIGGFERLLSIRPNTRTAVLLFGLFHGLGLATRVQELVPRDGLVVNLLSFNAGVEIGQVLALSALTIVFAWWRRYDGFARSAFAANTILMTCGLVLVGYQAVGYLVSQ